MKNITLIIICLSFFATISCQEPKPAREPSNTIIRDGKKVTFICQDEYGREAKCYFDVDCCEEFVCSRDINSSKSGICLHE